MLICDNNYVDYGVMMNIHVIRLTHNIPVLENSIFVRLSNYGLNIGQVRLRALINRLWTVTLTNIHHLSMRRYIYFLGIIDSLP